MSTKKGFYEIRHLRWEMVDVETITHFFILIYLLPQLIIIVRI